MLDRTIAAISTPYGRGGIAVIRISGEDAVNITEKVFKPFSKGKSLSDYPARTAVYGRIFDGKEKIDEGIATYFLAPNSFTGEDVVEISCHGGILLTQTVLSAVLSAGAVMAQAGEFTKRAFVNGKLSLTQAEAVIGLIDAESRDALRLQNAQIGGALSRKIDSIAKRLSFIMSSIYAYIDFPDEDMTDISVDELKVSLAEIKKELEALESTYRTGHAVAEGITTVIAGKPNTGKSSLLNMLLGKKRAIVTDIEGTTRDTIEETAFAGGVMLKLCDTAGIRNSDDKVEQLGVALSIEKMQSAQLIIAVFDGSSHLTQQDYDVIEKVRECTGEKIAVINKNDAGNILTAEELSHLSDFSKVIHLSCSDYENEQQRKTLSDLIEGMFADGSLDYTNDAVLVNARQYASVHKAVESISHALSALESGYTQDIAGLDIESAIGALNEEDGREISEEIVDGIFHNFCVGK